MRNPISSQVYHTEVKGKIDLPQNNLVIKFMREIGTAMTIRMLYRIINARGFEIDLVSLRRSITNLSKTNPKGQWLNQYNERVLFVKEEKECPISKKKVGWYQLTDKYLRDQGKQIDLFETKTKAA
jgi:hypothetical protein